MINESLYAVIILILIIPLIILAVYFLKKLSTQLPKGQQDILIVAQRQMGSKEKVAILEVNQEQFLIGITPENINMLYSFGPKNQKISEAVSHTDLSTRRGQTSK